MKAVILLSLLLAGQAGAQGDAPAPTLTEFRGLNTAANPYTLEPGEATFCLNWDLFQRKLTKRDGYYGLVNVTITTPTDRNSGFNGIYGYNSPTNGKILLHCADYDLQYYAVLRKMTAYTFDNGGTLMDYQYKGARSAWAQYGDMVIHANGKNRPYRYNGTNFQVLVEVPPGSWDLAPVAIPDTAQDGDIYYLNGDYYYAWQISHPCSTGAVRSYGPLSGPSWNIHTDSDWVVVHGAPEITATRNCDPDSTIIKIGRTTSGAEKIGPYYYVGDIAFHNDSLTYLNWLRTYLLIDSIPDDSLGSGVYTSLGNLDTVTHNADSTIDSCDVLMRPGQVALLGKVLDDTHAAGWMNDGVAADDTTWTHTRYFVTLYDSSTGMVSDSGPNTSIPTNFVDSIVMDAKIRLQLPPITQGKVNKWRIVWRGQELNDSIRTPDSALGFRYKTLVTPQEALRWEDRYSEIDCRDDGGQVVIHNGKKMCRLREWVEYEANQKVVQVGPFYPVDTIKDNTVDTLVDSIPWQTLVLSEPFRSRYTLPQANYPVTWNDRLYVASGSRVWYSETGEVGEWPYLNNLAFDIGDGDEITGIAVVGDILNVFKHDSWYRVTPDHQVITMSKKLGCVAPQSLLQLPGGSIWFLHSTGVYLFTGPLASAYKENEGELGPSISEPIANYIDNLTIDTLKQAVSIPLPDRRGVMLSFPTKDTSFVYYFDAGWTIWNFAPLAWTYYDTGYTADLQPSNDLLFVLDDSDSLYKYGGVKTDAGATVLSGWRAGPLYADPERYATVTQVDAIVESNDSANSMTVRWFDHGSTVLGNVTIDSVGVNKITSNAAKIKWANVLRPYVFSQADSLAVQLLRFHFEDRGQSKVR